MYVLNGNLPSSTKTCILLAVFLTTNSCLHSITWNFSTLILLFLSQSPQLWQLQNAIGWITLLIKWKSKSKSFFLSSIITFDPLFKRFSMALCFLPKWINLKLNLDICTVWLFLFLLLENKSSVLSCGGPLFVNYYYLGFI